MIKVRLFETAYFADLSGNTRRMSASPAYQLRVSSPAAAAAVAFADGSSRRSERIRSVGCHKCCSDCAVSPANHLYRHLRHMTVVCYVTFSQASNIHSS